MDPLSFENQLCFPFYAISRLMTAHYRPLLEKLGLTYPQYLVMLLLWDHIGLSINELGDYLLLDSGTMTPLIRRLEQKKLVNRSRSAEDEREVIITPTEKSWELREKAENIPVKLQQSLNLWDTDIHMIRKRIASLYERIRFDSKK